MAVAGNSETSKHVRRIGTGRNAMHANHIRNFQILVAAAGIALSPRVVFAQAAADYPNKPVRIVVGSSPGGGSDIQARMFAQKLSENLKQQFQIDNRPGAGDTIATGLVAKAAPDGYALLVASGSFTLAPSLYPKFMVDPLKDLAPISLVSSSPLLLLVHPSVPVKSIKELIAFARSSPNALNVGMGPGGTSTHLVAASFASAANIKLTLVPYQNVGQRYSDAVAGYTHIIFMPGSVASTYMKSGRLRALAVTSAKGSATFPELPALSQAGVPGYDVTVWYGFLAPAGTPAPIISKLNAELIKAVKSPDIIKRLADEGGDGVGSTPEQFGEFLAAEIPRWRKAIQDAGIRVD